jgi:hypothetical protein
MNALLGKGKLQLSGEMLSYSPLDHSLAGGTSWMANNELLKVPPHYALNHGIVHKSIQYHVLGQWL